MLELQKYKYVTVYGKKIDKTVNLIKLFIKYYHICRQFYEGYQESKQESAWHLLYKQLKALYLNLHVW